MDGPHWVPGNLPLLPQALRSTLAQRRKPKELVLLSPLGPWDLLLLGFLSYSQYPDPALSLQT